MMTNARFEFTQPHHDGLRVLLSVPDRDGKGSHNDPRDILGWFFHDDGRIEAAILDDDGELVGVGSLADQRIEVVKMLDRGDLTKREKWARIGRRAAETAAGAVT